MQRVHEIINGVRRQALDLLEEGSSAASREDRPLGWFATTPSLIDA